VNGHPASAERLRNKYTAVLWKRNHLNVNCWLKVEYGNESPMGSKWIEGEERGFLFLVKLQKKDPP
jgi:hypothetical protein